MPLSRNFNGKSYIFETPANLEGLKLILVLEEDLVSISRENKDIN